MSKVPGIKIFCIFQQLKSLVDLNKLGLRLVWHFNLENVLQAKKPHQQCNATINVYGTIPGHLVKIIFQNLLVQILLPYSFHLFQHCLIYPFMLLPKILRHKM